MHELRTAPRQRRSQKSIDAILDAAERLIHEHGQVTFTANQLAEAAGMSIGRVYYWFPDIPSVVSALVDRSAGRLIDEFRMVVERGSGRDYFAVLKEGVESMCAHIDKNPATVALCLTGRDGAAGQGLFDRLFDLASMLVRSYVPEISDPEVLLVSRTAVGITLGMLKGYTEAGQFREFVRDELVYVLSSWLYSRYPPKDSMVWTDESHPLRPARASENGLGTLGGRVYPAMAIPPD